MDYKIIVIYDTNNYNTMNKERITAPCMEVLNFSNLASYRRACDELKKDAVFGMKVIALHG